MLFEISNVYRILIKYDNHEKLMRSPENNPYTPNAGARPPILAGRSDELGAFDLLLGRLQRGYTAQSMIIIGLRGVGKTVLLGEFLSKAAKRDWATIEAEITKHEDFGERISKLARRALLQVAPRAPFNSPSAPRARFPQASAISSRWKESPTPAVSPKT